MSLINDEKDRRIEEQTATIRLLRSYRSRKLGHQFFAGRLFGIRTMGRRLPQAVGVQ